MKKQSTWCWTRLFIWTCSIDNWWGCAAWTYQRRMACFHSWRTRWALARVWRRWCRLADSHSHMERYRNTTQLHASSSDLRLVGHVADRRRFVKDSARNSRTALAVRTQRPTIGLDIFTLWCFIFHCVCFDFCLSMLLSSKKIKHQTKNSIKLCSLFKIVILSILFVFFLFFVL